VWSAVEVWNRLWLTATEKGDSTIVDREVSYDLGPTNDNCFIIVLVLALVLAVAYNADIGIPNKLQ
jgi:hypothetical protein